MRCWGYKQSRRKACTLPAEHQHVFVRCVTEGTITAIPFGAPGDIPVSSQINFPPGTAIGVYRPAINAFLLRNTLSAGPPDSVIPLGAPGDMPLMAYAFDLATDFANQIADVGIYRPSERNFYFRILNSGNRITFGASGDIPLVGDWTGSGRVQMGVFRPSTNEFFPRTTVP